MPTNTIHTPFTRATRMERLPALLRERILVLDGAMGTMVQRYQLSEADFRGERFADHPKDLRGDTDLLCLTKPDVVREIHAAYLAAGADIISTNSFTATRIAQADYGLSDVAGEMNEAASRLAREAADARRGRGRPAALRRGLAGPDQPDRLDLPGRQRPRGAQRRASGSWPRPIASRPRATSRAAPTCCSSRRSSTRSTRRPRSSPSRRRSRRSGCRIPVIISGTIVDASGRTLSGQTLEAFWTSIRHANPMLVGLNCALGAKQLREHVVEMSRLADVPLAAYPNAGLPNELGGYDETPEPDRHGAGRMGARGPDQPRRVVLREHARAHGGDRRGGRRRRAAGRPAARATRPGSPASSRW